MNKNAPLHLSEKLHSGEYSGVPYINDQSHKGAIL